jgi:hypothetical protein
MKLQKYIMEIIGPNWTTSKKLAEIIAERYPEEFNKAPYNGEITVLSMALGPSLYALFRQGVVKHDGVKWPDIKNWKRVQSEGYLSADDVASALVALHQAKDVDQGIRMLAARAVKDHQNEYKELLPQVSKISDEGMKIAKKLLGLDQ